MEGYCGSMMLVLLLRMGIWTSFMCMLNFSCFIWSMVNLSNALEAFFFCNRAIVSCYECLHLHVEASQGLLELSYTFECSMHVDGSNYTA
jgi:hypothetical protein